LKFFLLIFMGRDVIVGDMMMKKKKKHLKMLDIFRLQNEAHERNCQRQPYPVLTESPRYSPYLLYLLYLHLICAEKCPGIQTRSGPKCPRSNGTEHSIRLPLAVLPGCPGIQGLSFQMQDKPACKPSPSCELGSRIGFTSPGGWKKVIEESYESTHPFSK
jgi:hypothetical protein